MYTRSSLLFLLAVAPAFNPGCTCSEAPKMGPAFTAPSRENFERATLGPDWLATDPDAYRIEDGALVARRAYNHPL